MCSLKIAGTKRVRMFYSVYCLRVRFFMAIATEVVTPRAVEVSGEIDELKSAR